MLREDAMAVATVVEEAFRGASELDDDRLDPHLRQVFYDLQDEHILQVRRAEYEKDGRLLRGYFWRIEDAGGIPGGPQLPAPDKLESLYSSLRDHAWERREPQ